MCLSFSTFQSLKGRWKLYLSHILAKLKWGFSSCENLCKLRFLHNGYVQIPFPSMFSTEILTSFFFFFFFFYRNRSWLRWNPAKLSVLQEYTPVSLSYKYIKINIVWPHDKALGSQDLSLKYDFKILRMIYLVQKTHVYLIWIEYK